MRSKYCLTSLYLEHHPDGCAWRKRQQYVEQEAFVVLRAHCTAQETTCCCDRISSAPFAARYLRLKTPRYTRSPNMVARQRPHDMAAHIALLFYTY